MKHILVLVLTLIGMASCEDVVAAASRDGATVPLVVVVIACAPRACGRYVHIATSNAGLCHPQGTGQRRCGGSYAHSRALTTAIIQLQSKCASRLITQRTRQSPLRLRVACTACSGHMGRCG